MLLGCDIIDNKDITLNTKRGFQINGEWVCCELLRKPNTVARVKLKRAVTIPSNSQFVVSCVSDSEIDSDSAIFEPLFEDQRAIVVARAVVDPRSRKIPVRMINMSNRPIKLKRGYLLGEISSIEQTEQITSDITHTECDKSLNCRRQSVNLNNCKPDLASEFQLPKVNTTSLCTENVHNNDTQADSQIPEHMVDLYQKSCTNLDSVQKEILKDMLDKHVDVFAKDKHELGTCNLIKHKIDTAEALPIRQPLRRTPQGFEDEEEKYLKDQIESGVVVPSKSPWASPVVLVRKKDNSVRWCIDYRRLNDVTIKDAYPLPRIDMCLESLASAKIFSTCDLQSGYWQIAMNEKDKAKTAFITKYGLFEYTKMPFGVCNGPSTFQRCMELIFRGVQWKTLLIYLDDIIIFSSNFEEHMERLDEVLKRLQNAGLKLKPSKCEFLQDELLFLGHMVGKEGVRPNPKIIESVQSWKVPANVKEMQQFLGLCNYYRQFISHYSEMLFL